MALLALAVTVPFLDVIFSDSRFFVRDLTRYYYPTKKIIREVVLGGEFPYWNRHYSAGQPMAANPEYEVFYPPQWLIFLPDYDLGYRLHILVHVYLTAFGTYFLLRHLRLRIAASLFGAIAFGAGGVLLSYVNLLPILFAVAWIPWIAWLLLRAIEAPTLRRVAAASLTVGLQALVGEPTTLVQTWGLAALAAALAGWDRGRWLGAAKGLAIASTVLLVGFCIGAVQLLTAYDHVGDSARSRPFPLDLVTTWSMHPARPLELLAPNVFGHLFGDRTYWGSGLYRNTASPFIYSVYLGLPLVVLAAAAFATRARGRLPCAAVIAGSVLLALGEHTPLYALLYDVGLARSVRYPEKFLLPALLCLVLLGAWGFDRLVRRDFVVRRVALAIAVAVTAVSGTLALAALSPLARDYYVAVWGIRDELRLAQVVALARQDWIVSFLRGVALSGLLVAVWHARRRAWRVLFLLFLLVDLVPVGLGVLPRIDRAFFEEPPPVAAELDAPPGEARIFHEVDWYGRSDAARSYFRRGERAYRVIRNGMYPMTPAQWGFETVLERDYDKTALLPTVDFVDAMWQVRDAGQPRWREIFGAMSNVRYRAKYRPWEAEQARSAGDPHGIRPVDFIETDPAPRYYLADQIVGLRRPGEFATRLARETFSARVAFVEIDPFDPGEGRVISVEETANRSTIVVEADRRALLVASVTRHKYWSATVDGRPARLEPVNVAYQGIVLEPGRHEVVMSYRNPLVRPIGTFSLAVLAACLLALVLPRARASSRTITP